MQDITYNALKNILMIVNNKVDSILDKAKPIMSNKRTIFISNAKMSSRNEEYELKLLVDTNKFDVNQPSVEKL